MSTENIKRMQKIKSCWLVMFGVVSILAYVMPWIISGQSGYIRIHDGLDSIMAFQKIMSEQGFWFSPNKELVGPIFQGGLPRIAYPNELSVVTLLFSLFKPYWAYLINQLLIRLLAFLGMYLLLERFICSDLSKLRKGLIVCGTSIAFAYLPFWSWSGSIALLPWVFYALFRIWNNKFGIFEFIILIFYPFYSSIFLTGLYIVLFFWFSIPLSYLINRRVGKLFLSAILVTAAHSIVDYRYILFFLKNDFISHRSEFVLPSNSFEECINATINLFKNGDWAVTNSYPILLISILFSLFISLISTVNKPNNFFTKNRYLFRSEFILFSSCILISLYAGFWYWEEFSEIKKIFPLLNMINMTRLAFFLPFLWYFLFAISLVIIGLRYEKSKTMFFGICAAILFQIGLQISSHEFIVSKEKYKISFEEFYSEGLFNSISNSIGVNKNMYIVASIGIHPSITQFNGFKTADAYLANYPIEYKKRFRRAVYGEFKKSKALLSYYDEWGSRVYFFSSTLGCPKDDAVCTKKNTRSLPMPDFDIVAMKELGVNYIFSIFELQNPASSGLEYIETFEDKKSPWSISVYRLN
jgi:hypothetical protein